MSSAWPSPIVQARVQIERVGKDDMRRFHGIDERISVVNYADVVRFSVAFLQTR